MDQFPATIIEIMNKHLCSCIDETLKINVEVSSASGLMAATLCHLRKAHTFIQSTHVFIVSLCSQVENKQSKDNLAKFIYGSMDSW